MNPHSELLARIRKHVVRRKKGDFQLYNQKRHLSALGTILTLDPIKKTAILKKDNEVVKILNCV